MAEFLHLHPSRGATVHPGARPPRGRWRHLTAAAVARNSPRATGIAKLVTLSPYRFLDREYRNVCLAWIGPPRSPSLHSGPERGNTAPIPEGGGTKAGSVLGTQNHSFYEPRRNGGPGAMRGTVGSYTRRLYPKPVALGALPCDTSWSVHG